MPERVGKSLIIFSRHKGGSKGLTDTFYGFDEVKKTFWFVNYSYFKTRHLQQLKGMLGL